MPRQKKPTLRERAEAAERRVEEQSVLIQALKRDEAELRAELAPLRQSANRWRAVAETKTRALEERSQTIAQLRKDLADLPGVNELLEQERNELRGQVEQMQYRIKELRDKNRDQEGDLRILRSGEEALKRGCDEAMKRNQELEVSVKELTTALQELHDPATYSWPHPVLVGIRRAAEHLDRMGADGGLALRALIDTVAGADDPQPGDVVGAEGLRLAFFRKPWRDEGFVTSFRGAESFR